ncbi:AMP-binding protein [Streptacidiphilus jiangxiensis]|uniref:Long-chain acyl-CoA synthetase n=1 Tax=Streptacidiphilus jiangxiensis TaxID=235985 RepID=A0A1H7HPI4_STRJI|nr:AMP-binding protein [Streptacidiphilus jiangxiensis]SEK52179.1 long-chain acyl-CoA synthetase [Streptacidiphilus jiangxiensis]
MSNAAQPLWDHAASAPNRPALLGTAGQRWDYATLRDHVAAFAARLRAAGIGPGDRVLLVAPSVPEFVAAYHGLLSVGAIAVTANTMATAPELEYIGADAGIGLVIAWHALSAGPASGPASAAPAAAAAAAAVGVPFWALRRELGGPAGPDAPGEALPNGPVTVDADDTAAILYTSGTTGRPKGAMLTHGNLHACASIFERVHGLGPDDRAGTALPLFHVFGQACLLATTLRVGASLSLLPRFDPREMLDLIRDHRLTTTAGVPTMWNALLHAAGDADPADFASLRLASSGGASLPGEVKRAFEKRFGCTILEGYGLTETTGSATVQVTDRGATVGSVGAALPGCEVAIRALDGGEVPTGGIGEVHVRGPVVMKGYWGRPEATAEVLRDGWLATGDLGRLDETGELFIVDRTKDLVIRGGYNVYPREVEEVLYTHPDVVEAAVVGVPDDHYGEEVAAAIALRPGATPDAAALRAWAKERLSAYKVPHLVAFVDALPKGATGKILKRAIDRSLFEEADTIAP